MKKIVALVLIVISVMSMTAFADEWNMGVEINPVDNELFQLVGEISEEEYNNVEGSLWVNDEWNTQSPYFNLFPELRDVDKYSYNDGVKRDYYTYTQDYNILAPDGTLITDKEEYEVSGLYDINGNCIYTDPEMEISASAGSYVYNLGYIIITSVNFLDDGNLSICKTFENALTGQKWYFYVEECTPLLNDGSLFFKYNNKFYKSVLKKPAIVTVHLNGKKIYFDQIPVIDNGRTLVPVRAIFEELGAQIEWNSETKTVTAKKGDTIISLTVDSINAYKNEDVVNLDVPAKIIGGRTMVPVRFVSDCLGVNVEWNEDNRQIILTTTN